MRPITINCVMNGCIVQVGCQTLVFQERAEMLSELRRYLDNPEQVEKEYVIRFGAKNPALCEATGSTGGLLTIQAYSACPDVPIR